MTRPDENAAIGKVVLLMVKGVSGDNLTKICMSRLGMEQHEADEVIANARRKLTRAADYNRDEQLGTAVARLNEIFASAFQGEDPKTALAAQKELNKLLDLYNQPPAGPEGAEGGSESDGELAAIAAHLLPLTLAADDYPLREHARIAAEEIRKGRAPGE